MRLSVEAWTLAGVVSSNVRGLSGQLAPRPVSVVLANTAPEGFSRLTFTAPVNPVPVFANTEPVYFVDGLTPTPKDPTLLAATRPPTGSVSACRRRERSSALLGFWSLSTAYVPVAPPLVTS